MIEESTVSFTYLSGIEALAEVSLGVEGGEPRLSEYGNAGNETDAYRLL